MKPSKYDKSERKAAAAAKAKAKKPASKAPAKKPVMEEEEKKGDVLEFGLDTEMQPPKKAPPKIG